MVQATPATPHFTGNWAGSAMGYDLSNDAAALDWFAHLTPAQLAQVEFDYPAGNGAWTDSECGVAQLSGSTLVMDQPCWTNVTDIAPFSQGSGGPPSMSTSQPPARIQGARNPLTSGQWFLDSSTDTLYYGCTYDPTPTATPASMIKDHCTPDPKTVQTDQVGTNEIHTRVCFAVCQGPFRGRRGCSCRAAGACRGGGETR